MASHLFEVNPLAGLENVPLELVIMIAELDLELDRVFEGPAPAEWPDPARVGLV